MKLSAWGKSDAGQKRGHNEDSFLINPQMGLFAVADGMGGHQGGETASRLALEVLERLVVDSLDHLDEIAAQIEAEKSPDLVATRELSVAKHPRVQPGWQVRLQRAATQPMDDDPTESMSTSFLNPPASTVIRAAAVEAGIEIYDAALQNPNLRGMGTTLTAMLYHGGRMHIVHAGDSRAYLFRDNHLEQLTEDHSWIAEQIKLGAMTEVEARESKYRHIITRSVGFEREVALDIGGVAVQAGDCFLLCTDGLYNYLENRELECLLRDTWYSRTPELFINLANQRGGDDNITVVVVHVANHVA